MKYKIIYADPPWSYNDKMIGHGGAEGVYKTQSKDWIENLPVGSIADKDCVLFLWAVSPLLPEALQVIKSWGFKYKTLGFCWVKEHREGGLFVKNLGRYTMGGVELCLIATKGSPKRLVNNIRQVHFDTRTKHSKKPDAIRDKIVEMFGDIPRVELFARNKTPGWDVFGNEVDDSIKLDTV